MPFIELRLTGAKELSDKLRAMPAKLEKEALQESVLYAMDSAWDGMVAAAPDHGYDEQSPKSKEYGTAKENIVVFPIKRGLHKNVYGARISTGDAFWMYWYEMGSRHQSARPWFYPKFRSMAQNILDEFTVRVGAAIEKLWAEK